MKHSQTLHFNSEKKHSVRYDSLPGEVDAMLTSIYVGKKQLPREFPKMILVTIETQDT